MNFQRNIASFAIRTTMIVCALFFATTSFSQLTIGIKSSTPTLSAKESSNEYYEPQNQSKYGLTYVSTRSSYSFGLSFYKDLDFAFVMSDLLYRETQVDYRLEMRSHLGRESAALYDCHRILSIPVIAGFQKKNFKIGVGPVFNIKIDSDYGLTKYEGFNLATRKINKAVQFVIGYKIKNHIHVDLRHEISLDAEGDDYNIVGNPLKIYSHPQSFSVSVGIYL